MPRLSKAQQQYLMDLDVIKTSGHDLRQAVDFFRRHGIQLSRHPKYGWQFTAVLAGRWENTAAFWHCVANSVATLIEWLDAPSTVIAARDEAQKRLDDQRAQG